VCVNIRIIFNDSASNYKKTLRFVVHRAVHRSVISIVKPTRCTNVSNLFTLERHSTCFLRPFRPSSGFQDCTYSNMHLSNRYCCLLASKQKQYLFDKCILLYVQSWNPDDGRKGRKKHVECRSKVNKFDTLVYLVGFYCRNNGVLCYRNL